ncbi:MULTISPECIES: integron-associated HEPN domain-containing protein [Acinetobacter]|uniref:HEPN-like integron domain-containing protein n=1 Tax=Acinetobacter higginsii TaxID=70347 RepID=N9RJK7_9GAMM|nr:MULTISPECIES: integron-associated HEPN domain-containing protein [Acinetobacter]ENX58139.1 hypothetical protein F902_02539 [Acinetobacter higginsii]
MKESTISKEEHEKLSQLYFFLQDISLELQADSAIFNIVEQTYDNKEFVMFEDNVSAKGIPLIHVGLGAFNKNVLPILAKVAFQNIILCICRAYEAVNNTNSGKILNKYCPKSLRILHKQLNDSYDNVVGFRNSYVAHPLDGETKNFVPVDQLVAQSKKIIGVSEDKKISIGDFLNYVKKLHFMNETDPNHSFTWAIRNMHDELKENGVTPKRF